MIEKSISNELQPAATTFNHHFLKERQLTKLNAAPVNDRNHVAISRFLPRLPALDAGLGLRDEWFPS